MAKKDKNSPTDASQETPVEKTTAEETENSSEETSSDSTAGASDEVASAENSTAPASSANDEHDGAKESVAEVSLDKAEPQPEVPSVVGAASEAAGVVEAPRETELATPSGITPAQTHEVLTKHSEVIDDEGEEVLGIAAYFDEPDELLHAATKARGENFDLFDAFSPFPIHGMDDAMGIGRSWIPWVTFGAGTGGFLLANALQFGVNTFDWPMNIGGKPFAPWPSFVPVMFELTVLLAGVTSAIVMLFAAGCFRKPLIIDREITNDRFVLWISAKDKKFDRERVQAFMQSLNPVEIRTVNKGA